MSWDHYDTWSTEPEYGGRLGEINAMADDRSAELRDLREAAAADLRRAQTKIKMLMALDANACHAPRGYDWSDVEGLLDDFASMDVRDTAEDYRRICEEDV